MTAQELKNSILQLAVQGKLVPQDKNDEPASELLKRIQTEKARLIKEGKIKKEKALPPITGEELPFDIPESWEWLRLGDIGAWGSGATPSKSNSAYYNNATIPWLVTGDLNDSIITDIPGKITEKALRETSVKLNPANSVLIAMYGATIGKVGLLSFPATTNQACCACQTFTGINLWYLMYFLMSQRQAFIKRGEGGAQPNISKEKIVVTLIPIPPLAEQERIVAKIEELLPFINEYDEVEKRLTLLNAEFPDKLRKSILQQAVQGKLTERDPADEPASELLQCIRAEKTTLVAEGKVYREKELKSISNDDIPFDIPDQWEWCKLGELTRLITKGSSPSWQGVSYTTEEKGVLFVTSENVGVESMLLEKRKYVEPKFNEMHPSSILQKGDLLTNIVGASIGRTALFDENVENANINQAVCLIRLVNTCLTDYLLMYLNSATAIKIMTDKSVDSARANLSLTSVTNLLVPLPPLAEQKRIVARVEELLALCEQLKK